MAIYREFCIGAAKPTREGQARAPHHLFDEIDPVHYTTAGEYARRARKVLIEIRQRGTLPIVVGGTGLYLRALLEGLFPGPERREELRKRLGDRARKGPRYLHRILKRLDPIGAEGIHANDMPKVIRAIEVCLSTRQSMSEQWKLGRAALEGFRILRIGLDPNRAKLYAQINKRVQAMFDAGLVEETNQLLEKYGDEARPLRSIGYKQVVHISKKSSPCTTRFPPSLANPITHGPHEQDRRVLLQCVRIEKTKGEWVEAICGVSSPLA